ncbi:hypothetical protein [Phenylobacterium sp.]|uniref:hypothetical protein n=1 Tax=Phenylobacterium sp. TaxID=1871053 RepID=UPI0025E758D5|nr:hypothetical protein [Phenylobacterium sp.]
MSDDVSTSKRDLVARIATLELLVADLIDALWRVDPRGMNQIAAGAGQDADSQEVRQSLPVGEPDRERLYSVLETRSRMLRRKKADA